jgi:GH43 family beta-xylosidase
MYHPRSMRLGFTGVIPATATVLIALACGEDAASAKPVATKRRSDHAPVDRARTPAPESVPGLRTEYFAGYHDKVITRLEPAIDHDWKDEAPGPGVGADHFSVRWTGIVSPSHSGKTTFFVDADDGVRLWLDGKLVIDDWRGHSAERHSAVVDLTAGKPVAIRLDYFEADRDASVRLSWSVVGLPEEVVPANRFSTTNQASGLSGPKPPFRNPVIAADCPDPGVLGVGGGAELVFYTVCTGGAFPVRTSRDLVNWTDVVGAALLPDGKPTWAANGGRNWAAELHRIGNEFLAYYTSVNASNVLSIGVAHAPSPAGPWTDRGAALVEDASGVIDANFFEDDDGSRWLFYKIDGNAGGKPTPILVRRLAPDGLSFAEGSAPTPVLVNDATTWEGNVVEAPWVIKHDGRYYMFYSGNAYDHRYRTGVARAPSLTGPWEKAGAPLLASNDVWVGPGHGSVVRLTGADPSAPPTTIDYFVYHAWQNAGDGTAATAKGRMVLLDRITWKDGWPSISDGTPSKAAQPWPGEPF